MQLHSLYKSSTCKIIFNCGPQVTSYPSMVYSSISRILAGTCLCYYITTYYALPLEICLRLIICAEQPFMW